MFMFDLKKYPMRVEMGDTVVEDIFCLGIVGNTLSVGGRTIFKNEDVYLNDGLFECALVRYPSSILEYQQIVHAFLSNDLSSCANIKVYKVKDVTFTSLDEVAWTLDGEFGGNYKNVHIHNIKGAIKMLK